MRALAVFALALLAASAVHAQANLPDAPVAPTSAPAGAAAAPSAPASAPVAPLAPAAPEGTQSEPPAAPKSAGDSSRPAAPNTPRGPVSPGDAAGNAQRVEITGGRSDTEQRRQSTVSKIVIGREEIERQGDSTLGEILKRLPGVTLGGPPGRGGQLRFRGLGAGYTQILLDGDRVPPGFQIDSISPEQIQRIEILRAPTAETGARAIGGTINIVTREGYSRKINDVKLGAQYESDHGGAGFSWTRNDKLNDDWIVNTSLSLLGGKQESFSSTTTTDVDLGSGALTRLAEETSSATERRQSLHLNTRAQYQNQSDVGFVAPFIVASQGHTDRFSTFSQPIGNDPPAPYDHAVSATDWEYSLLRVLGQWRHRLPDGTRMEWRGNAGQSRNDVQTRRNELDASDALLGVVDDTARIRDRSLSLGLKGSKLLDSDHSLVGGVEAEGVRRLETRTTVRNGVPLLTDFGDNLEAASSRAALYAQDEWAVNANWGAHAGLRWEGIVTTGTGDNGEQLTNRSSVLSPLLHAVWKPVPDGRDQIRMSLTRSYKAPTLQSLLARPAISPRFPTIGCPTDPDCPNTPTSPDRAGNPNLKPELATGLDVAAERYLAAGGLLSASLFMRSITNTMRSVTSLETVSWSPVPRWVSRPQNVGDALTQGLELEAKFRLSEVMGDAPPLELRTNLSFFHSRVKSVPGPDNRLDQQPDMTANVGADYRIRSLPLTLGGNVHYTPGFETRLSEQQSALTGSKLVFDAYALWTFKPGAALRLSATNLAPRDYTTGGSLDFDSALGAAMRETVRTVATTYTQWQLRLELKL
ncbi:MAG TPA: TonB-dependent receptor [Burkholderiaceae bacterium]|nr:TonB-dependent receptor [Burkholderiaceae bacterium]